MTNKEIAERMRDMSNRIGSLTQESLTELADQLDPPRPEPGAVVWWRSIGAKQWHIGEASKNGVDVMRATYRWHTIEWKPARILGPGEVAVKVPPVGEWPEGASSIQLVYETEYIGTTYTGEKITHAAAERMEADR